jgi:PhnB protein
VVSEVLSGKDNPMAKKKAAKKPARRKAPARKSTASRGAGRRAAGRSTRSARAAARGAPAGMHTVTPQLTFREAARAIEFYKQAFGAQELMRMPSPDGKSIWHAEIRIGDSVVFLADESPQSPVVAPSPTHRPTALVQLYVSDCDAVFQSAVQAGARVIMPLADMFWGDRYGLVTDPFGQVWGIATHVKDLGPEEMKRAGEEFAAKNMPPPQTQPS